MSCSVKSTPMPRSRAMPAVSCISWARSLRRHAGGRLVHQQQLGRAGERDGELHALDVAIGQLAAGPVGVGGHADALEQRQRLLAIEAGRVGPPGARAAVAADQRHLHVLGHGHGHERLRHLEGAADAEAPDAARRQAGDVVCRRARRGRCRAASWPPTMLKMVDLPAPLGPMTASSLPASTANVTSLRGHHAAERFAAAPRRSAGSCRGPPLGGLRPISCTEPRAQLDGAADEPARERPARWR